MRAARTAALLQFSKRKWKRTKIISAFQRLTKPFNRPTFWLLDSNRNGSERICPLLFEMKIWNVAAIDAVWPLSHTRTTEEKLTKQEWLN